MEGQKEPIESTVDESPHFGITSHQQDGWELIFNFESPPQHGYVSMRSLL